jgi:hypothetical protein
VALLDPAGLQLQQQPAATAAAPWRHGSVKMMTMTMTISAWMMKTFLMQWAAAAAATGLAAASGAAAVAAAAARGLDRTGQLA